MAHTGSSSRRKHSKKKKSLKVSSEGYRKKKSRRNKSKKLRHHDDSFSSHSDDESTSSSLSSSSSSEGEYKRKRARSHSRNESKGSKKRNRRRSLSVDSSEDSSPVKKRKRSKKSKKINKKKKKSIKRDAYISSASSDSGSCSTCKDEDSSSDEVGSHGRSRGRSREKKKGHRDTTKGRIGNRKNRSRTRSVSPSSSHGSESIEKVTLENNPMRLKSIITVANLENEEEEDSMKNDELKEETVYDYDDYPSSKSNDSNELVDRFNSSPDKKSVVKEVNSGVDKKETESNVSGNIVTEADNLESILRQKALENLSRFRKAKPVDDKPKSDQSGVKQLKHETVSMLPLSQPAVNRSKFTWRRDPSVTTSKDEKAATYSEPRSSGSQPAELKLQSADLSSTSRVDNKFVNETSEIIVNVDQKSTTVIETPSSASIKEGSSSKTQANDNSQFEKKTMSVMRGGEMVQVSYKVYIPNRAPALARRQLKR